MAKSSRIREERIEDFAMVPQGKRPSTSRDSGSRVRSHFVEDALAIRASDGARAYTCPPVPPEEDVRP